MARADLYEQIIAATDGLYGAHAARDRALHAKGPGARGRSPRRPRRPSSRAPSTSQGEPVAALIRFSNAPATPRPTMPSARRAASRSSSAAATARRPTSSRPPRPRSSPARRRSSWSCSGCAAPIPRPASPTSRGSAPSSPSTRRPRPRSRRRSAPSPLASLATAVYFSPHTFWLLDAAGERRPARYRWLPDAGEQHISDDEAKARGRDYLYDELAERLAAGRSGSSSASSCPGRGRSARRPDRALARRPRAGRRPAASRSPRSSTTPSAADTSTSSTRLRLVDGLEPSDDPILHARAAPTRCPPTGGGASRRGRSQGSEAAGPAGPRRPL